VDFDRFTLVILFKAESPDAVADVVGGVDEIQDAHMSHLADLHDAGSLLAAGPLGDDHYRGLVLLATDAENAERLMRDDPAVRAGRLDIRVMPWMVPAGAMQFSATHFPRSMAEVG
jgi:uncharacterized protein YciI